MKFLEGWLQSQWYARERPNPGLLPLEALFRAAVSLRRLGYRKGLKAAGRLPVPVIVVGNLTVGGVGKTPLVIWLIETLRDQGYRPGVISRGYGGQTAKQPRAVTADSDPAEVGDEPLMVALRTGAPVFVHPNRFEAGKALLSQHDCDVIIADDGLQHYALARDVEIVVVDGERRYGNGHLLPAGPMREPEARIAEADLVVCRGEGRLGEYMMTVAGDVAVNLADAAQTRPLADFRGESLVALAGIGNPQSFFDLLTKHGLAFEAKAFPDHHRFVAADILRDGRTVLMTEKDAVKCRPFAAASDWYVPVSAQLPEGFGDSLVKLIQVKCNGQKTA